MGNKNLKHFREAFSSLNPEVERTLKRIVFSVEFSRAGSAFSFLFFVNELHLLEEKSNHKKDT